MRESMRIAALRSDGLERADDTVRAHRQRTTTDARIPLVMVKTLAAGG